MQNTVYNTVPFVYKSDYTPLCIYVSLCMYILGFAKNISFLILYRNINEISLTMSMEIGNWKCGRGHVFTLCTSKLLRFCTLKIENNNS